MDTANLTMTKIDAALVIAGCTRGRRAGGGVSSADVAQVIGFVIEATPDWSEYKPGMPRPQSYLSVDHIGREQAYAVMLYAKWLTDAGFTVKLGTVKPGSKKRVVLVLDAPLRAV